MLKKWNNLSWIQVQIRISSKIYRIGPWSKVDHCTKFGSNPSITFFEIPADRHTYRQTERQTDRQTDGHDVSHYLRNFVGEGNKPDVLQTYAQARNSCRVQSADTEPVDSLREVQELIYAYLCTSLISAVIYILGEKLSHIICILGFLKRSLRHRVCLSTPLSCLSDWVTLWYWRRADRLLAVLGTHLDIQPVYSKCTRCVGEGHICCDKFHIC